MSIKSICVYCSASSRVDEIYHNMATKVGQLLAQQDIQLVYGGSRVGLMGTVADATIANGGRVYGVITKHLVDYEVAHDGIQELHVAEDMHTRKAAMFEKADAFLVMPGGFGTLEEFFEIMTWKQIGLHGKPIVILNYCGFWTPLKALMDKIAKEKFATSADKNLYAFVDTIEEALPALFSMPQGKINPTAKWC